MWFGYEQTQAQCLLFQGFNRYQVVAHPCLLGPWQYKKAEAAAIPLASLHWLMELLEPLTKLVSLLSVSHGRALLA